jgi:hypothetical protein
MGNFKYSFRREYLLGRRILRKTSNKPKIIAIVSPIILIVLTIPLINAQTVAITVESEPLMPGDSVTVEGTDFAATSAVGIGIGEEVTVTWETHDIPEPAGYGPFTAIVNHYPIKPGSLSFHCDVSDVTSDYYDDFGNGTLNTTSVYALDPFVNYVTGEFGRSTNSPWDGYIVVFYANYTYYEYGVTPDAGVTTDGAGVFTASVTVPAEVVNGEYSVTAVDEQGNFATSTQTFQKIPEGLTFGVMVSASSVAVLVGSRYLWNRSRKREK